MQLTPFEWALWITVILSQAAVMVRMMLSGAWRKWPGLFCFLLVLTVKDLARIGNAFAARDPFIDFYVFWGGSLLADLIEVWMMVNVGLRLGGISLRARRLISRGLPALATSFLIGTTVYAFHAFPVAYERLAFVAERLDVAVGIAWLASFLVLAICSEIIGIEWSHGVRGIAAGFTLELLSANYIGWLTLHNSASQSLLADIKSGVYLISLAVWAASTGRERPEGQHGYMLSEILRFLDAYKRLFERLEEVHD